MNPDTTFKALVSGLFALLITFPAAAANPAGTAVFVSGKATATDPAGGVRPLKARDPLYSGDLLETGKGRIQIKYIDGAFMSIQPNSKFQIEDYNFANGSDGSEKAVYNLFKGGMRAFTGAIGKKHSGAYKVKTPVATIGIRGTGHNTRICSGDCTSSAGLPLPDGLYHSTWEGTTYVENDTGVSVVPFGNSVYVQSIDTPAEETNEASQVTAVQTSGGGDVLEEEQETTLEFGEQEDPNDFPLIPVLPPPDPLTLQAGLNQVSVAPPQPDTEDSVDISLLFETIEFIGPDGPIGAYGTEVNDGPPGLGTLATIDPLAILASGNPAAAPAQALINAAQANPDNDALFEAFFANPASIAEFTVENSIGFGRWFNGLVLLLAADGSVALKELVNDDSLHFIFGNSPAVAGAGAIGTYDFIGGTDSTGSLGDGVTSGQLTFDFNDMSGTIAMTVSHGIIYTLEGDLLIDVVFPSLFADDGTLTATTTSGNCSVGSGCTAFVEGSFFGPLVEGAPAGAGLEYDINEVGEVIKGVAAFTRVANPPPPPPELTQLPSQTLLGIAPVLVPGTMDDEYADSGLLSDTTVLIGSDSVGTNGMAGALGTELDQDESGNDQLQETLLTIDPNGVLAVSSPDSAVSVAQGFITDALESGGEDAAAVNAVIAGPAKVAEHTEGTFKGNNFSYGSWHNGQILIIDRVTQPGPNFDSRAVESVDLATDQRLAYLYGDTAGVIDFEAGATGTYGLINETITGGSASISSNGGPPGGGVQSGSLAFDFTTLNGTLAMEILHVTTYMVSGDLRIDAATPVSFENVIDGVHATTDGGPCGEESCETYIEGSFFGALDGTEADGAPVLAGLDYEIVIDPFDPETSAGESITGNAIFGRSGTADPIPDPDPSALTLVTNQTALGIETNLFRAEFNPDNADGGIITAATVLTGPDSTGTPGLAGVIGSEVDEDDTGMSEDATLDLLITIDPNGILALESEDANVNKAQGFINDALNDEDNEVLVNTVIADPATVAEYTEGSHLGADYALGRLGNGKILFIDAVVDGPNTGTRTVEVDDLGVFDHFHHLSGDMAATNFGVDATGEYTFLTVEGIAQSTDSTDTHGNVIGDGVQSGSILFDFTTLNGRLKDMVVVHGDTYTVNGYLQIDQNRPGEFVNVDQGVNAVTGGESICASGCETLIDGSFFGALAAGTGVDAAPVLAGLEYEIITQPFSGLFGNSIIGNGIFERSGTSDPLPFAVRPGQGMVTVQPNPDPEQLPGEFAEVGTFVDVTTISGEDSSGTPGLIAAIGTEFDDDFSPEAQLFTVTTIDPIGIFVLDVEPGSDEFKALTLINQAILDEANSALFSEYFESKESPDDPNVVANPATVAEYFEGDGYALTRWADGDVLALSENIGGGGTTGTQTANVFTIGPNQGWHEIHGDAPQTPLAGSSGTYEFIHGTHSTNTLAGGSIGNGVTAGGILTFDFDNLSGAVAMNVNHDSLDYAVNGPLAIDPLAPGVFYDTGSVFATATGVCASGCDTFINGGFAGELSSVGGGIASPAIAGLAYDITLPVFDESPDDGITGVAAFGRTGPAPPPQPSL